MQADNPSREDGVKPAKKRYSGNQSFYNEFSLTNNNIINKEPSDSAQNIETIINSDEAGVNKQLTVNTSSSSIIDIDSTPTVVLGIRIPYEIYVIYRNFDSKKKKLLKKIVAAAILGLVNKEVKTPQQNIIMNVNISTSHAQAVNNVTMDPKILEEENKVLRREKEKLKEIVKFYEDELEHARRDLKELEKRIKVLEAENKRLAREAGRLSDLEDTNKRLHAKLAELKTILEEIAQTSSESHVLENVRKALDDIYNY